MPLRRSYTKGAVAHNIKVEQDMGRPHNQAVAIALGIRDAALRRKRIRDNPGTSKLPDW